VANDRLSESEQDSVQIASRGAVSRSLRALALLAGEPDGLPLVRIARTLNLPKSAAHRILAILAAEGFVQQDEVSQNYRLTMRLTTLGYQYLSRTRILDLCQTILDRLATATNELVRMTIAEGENISWIAKAQGCRTGLRFDPDMGREVRLATTASGRVWLACHPIEFVVKAVLKQGFSSGKNLGPNACRNLESVLAAVEQARAQGFGLAVDEDEAGMSAIAVPILGEAGAVPFGTVSVAGPTARMTPEKLIGFHPLLLEAAAELATLWPYSRLGRSPAS
jgi:DNA-binding IclR family transcriptional regulator